MASVGQSDHFKGILGWYSVDSGMMPSVVATPAATLLYPLYVADFECELGEVSMITSDASKGVLTGANTNTIHVNLLDGGAEAAGTTELANIDFVSGTNLAVGKTILFQESVHLGGSHGEAHLDPGDILQIQYEKIGNGHSAIFPEVRYRMLLRPASELS